MKPQSRMAERLYKRYEYLAAKYASRIFSYESLSFEYEDLLQEFRVKIYTSLLAYARRWKSYKEGQSPKPVPLRFYLEAACGNKMRDFMKYISRETGKVSLDDISFDYGVYDDTDVNPGENVFVLKGVDLLEGLEGKERMVFSLYLRGYANTFIAKVYNNKNKKEAKAAVTNIINSQKEKIITKYGKDLLKGKMLYKSYSYEENC